MAQIEVLKNKLADARLEVQRLQQALLRLRIANPRFKPNVQQSSAADPKDQIIIGLLHQLTKSKGEIEHLRQALETTRSDLHSKELKIVELAMIPPVTTINQQVKSAQIQWLQKENQKLRISLETSLKNNGHLQQKLMSFKLKREAVPKVEREKQDRTIQRAKEKIVRVYGS